MLKNEMSTVSMSCETIAIMFTCMCLESQDKRREKLRQKTFEEIIAPNYIDSHIQKAQ